MYSIHADKTNQTDSVIWVRSLHTPNAAYMNVMHVLCILVYTRIWCWKRTRPSVEHCNGTSHWRIQCSTGNLSSPGWCKSRYMHKHIQLVYSYICIFYIIYIYKPKAGNFDGEQQCKAVDPDVYIGHGACVCSESSVSCWYRECIRMCWRLIMHITRSLELAEAIRQQKTFSIMKIIR